MGLRYTTRLYKPIEKNIGAAVLTTAQKLGAYARPSDDSTDMKLLRIGERGGVFTAELPYCDGDFLFFQQLARELGGVWIEARIQEGSHWDYSLSSQGGVLDSFSTLPEYWDDSEVNVLSQQGRPELLAKAWDIPAASIEQYIRQWGMCHIDEDTYQSVLSGKAYPDDRFEYGQYDQLFDFLDKLNYTAKMSRFFELRIPQRNYSPKRDFIEDLSTPENSPQSPSGCSRHEI